MKQIYCVFRVISESYGIIYIDHRYVNVKPGEGIISAKEIDRTLDKRGTLSSDERSEEVGCFEVIRSIRIAQSLDIVVVGMGDCSC
jgi:hypothetical protein